MLGGLRILIESLTCIIFVEIFKKLKKYRLKVILKMIYGLDGLDLQVLTAKG